ncbi:unnamed protein product [Diplocarpon coronariae]|uniref:Uncharacterized protein n=1 Tax=Diplocarpon coronariae TaxID=2795749 RepID=A0A218Z2H4_9HELO|nr:hypothetical protein B2J93_4690 [Marssonina coronariae]
MTASARMVMARVALSTLNRTTGMNGTATSVHQTETDETGAAGNSTSNLISNLVFAESKSVRTSTIILATFNILAAFATACRILYDCHRASRRCSKSFRIWKLCSSSLHPAETFPMVLVVGIALQGLVFAGTQGEGLSSLFVEDVCGLIAQFMWPALFIVPLIQVVFGIECAIRSLRSTPFQARGKWDVPICLGVIMVSLVGVWIPSHIWTQPRSCFASLVWFVAGFGQLGFILLCIAAGLMIAATTTIFIRLSTVNVMDPHQRMAASRMVYHLVLGILSLAFVIPFFFSLIGDAGDLKLAMMATVVLNLSGLLSGLLHLFLRSNAAATSIAPIELEAQVAAGKDVESRASRAGSETSLIGFEKRRGVSISMESFGIPSYRATANHDEAETRAGPAVAARSHTRDSSYYFFPREVDGATKAGQYRESDDDTNDWTPPPHARSPGGPRHLRKSSTDSTATVQIGLRLSHVPDISQEDFDFDASPLQPTTYKALATMPLPQLPAATYNIAPLPAAAYSPAPLPSTTYSIARPLPSQRKPVQASTPLTLQTNFAPSTVPARALSPPYTSPTSSPQQSPRAPSDKMFPATPKPTFPQIERMRESTTQLSPAVYSPSPAVYSLSPTVYSPEKRTATSNPSRASPPGSPESSSSRALKRTKMDWI